MTPARSELIPFYAIGAWLGVALLLPIAAFPMSYLSPTLANVLFFGPQYMFSFRWLANGAGSESQLLFEPPLGTFFTIIFWLTVAGVYWTVMRRVQSRSVVFLIAPFAIVAATIAAHWAFGRAGYELLLDGP